MVLILFILCALLTSGCYVNRALYDPFSFAPDCPSSCWRPDPIACQIPSTPTQCEIPSDDRILSLGEVIDYALQNNPETQITWAEARQAAALYGKSQASAFPNIGVEYNYTSNRTAFLSTQVDPSTNKKKERLFTSNQSFWGPQSYLTWTLLDFGQRRYTSEAARYALYFADYTHNRTIQTIIEKVSFDFYNLLAQIKLLEANEADLGDTQEVLDAANLALKQGVKDISDVLQSRTQSLLAELTLYQQRKTVKEAYAILLRDMGLPADATIQVQKLPIIDPEEVEIDSLPTYIGWAKQHRPDLLAAQAQVCSMQMELAAAKRAWTPTIDYSLQVGTTTYTGGLNDKYDYTSLISVSMPIFTGYSIRNNIRLCSAKLDEAIAQAKQTELNVISDITIAHFNVQETYNSLKAAMLLLDSAKEQYKVSMDQYGNGVNTILNVVSAQTALFDARSKEAEATKQWFMALKTLAYSTGFISCSGEEMR